MGISICIPTYNRISHLKRLVDSIFKGFAAYPYEIIIADGGSTDGTIEYLKSLDKNNIILIEQGKLIGVTKSCNVCFKLAKYEYIFLATDDFIIVPEVLIKACNLMDSHKEIGLVAPKMQESMVGQLPGVDLVITSLVLSKIHIFRASALKEINYLDENFRMYGADNDSCLAILNKGYTVIFTKEVGVIHNRIGDKSSILTHGKDIIHRDREYFKRKWSAFGSRINEYLSLKFSRKCKYSILRLSSMGIKGMFYLKLNRLMPKRYNYVIEQLYDRLLEKYIYSKVEEYEPFKDFYLAQKIPKEILKNNNYTFRGNFSL